MNQNWGFETGAGFEKLVEARVVDCNTFSVDVLELHAEVLIDLQSLSAVAHIFLELKCNAVRIISRINSGKINVGKNNETRRIATLHVFDSRLESVPESAA